MPMCTVLRLLTSVSSQETSLLYDLMKSILADIVIMVEVDDMIMSRSSQDLISCSAAPDHSSSFLLFGDVAGLGVMVSPDWCL